MKKTRKSIAVLLATVMMLMPLSGCKKQDAPAEFMNKRDVKKACLKVGEEFFTAFTARDIEEMANASSVDLREDFIDNANEFLIAETSYSWVVDYYNDYLPGFQVVEGNFDYDEDENPYEATINYQVLTATYDGLNNLISYKVTLKFEIDHAEEEVFVKNPEVALGIYDDMVDDYARFVVAFVINPDEMPKKPELEPEEETKPEDDKDPKEEDKKPSEEETKPTKEPTPEPTKEPEATPKPESKPEEETKPEEEKNPDAEQPAE